ncbi:hypothetical protein PAXRUDRAFT_133477 [Paxillus rubicundulus Ve08.2h10]|uniref:Arrestin-like N-terminal domain-containing protein n=1 Tax=Paxillus rubicundulus Ve08.2h10 TaxID=930991 RepID=A0A0D0DJW8_9AGAM|nr:hypothetical protein PAXRUDRAFT_133477 [Paxillus rubicundulus Ve08.2h10]
MNHAHHIESFKVDCDAVPPYTPSPPSPSYSTNPLPGEQSIEHTRHASLQPLNGVCRRITDTVTVVLRDQRPGSIHPTYDRGGVVRGDLILKSADDLTSVTLKLEGLLFVEKSGVSITTTLCSMTYSMWSASQGRPCPQKIPFAAILPLTFEDGGHPRRLPPTFAASEPHVVCSYSLIVELSRPRQFLHFLRARETVRVLTVVLCRVRVPFIYRPRSRPHRPMLPSDLPFMITVKSSPEEWHQIMCTVDVSKVSTLDPIQCLLFIPSVQVYALSDTIPFHLQIRGSPASLVPFLEQIQTSGVPSHLGGGVTIRVYLLRQTGIKIHERSLASSRVLGEGEMEPSHALPSKHHVLQRHPLGEGLDSLDWEGEIRCSDNAAVPSFVTSQLYVKDLITISITPRQPLESPLLSVKHFHPIRLVTDTWTNEVIN